MKEFEKWLETFYKNHRGVMRFEPRANHGWKAALEWVLGNKRFCQECDYNIDADLIKKELDGVEE